MSKKSVPRTCPECGREYPAAMRGGKPTPYCCSPECANKFKVGKPLKPRDSDLGPTEKLCPKCGTVKPIAEFYPSKERRYGVDGSCKLCTNARAVAWARKHPDKRDGSAKRWHQKHPEKMKQIQRNRYRRNHPNARSIEEVKKAAEERAKRGPTPEEIEHKKLQDREKARRFRESHIERSRESNKRWYANNRDRSRERNRRWLREHPEETRAKNRRHLVAKSGIPGSHTAAEWKDLCERFECRCVRCGRRRPLTRDHIIPVTQFGSTDFIENIQPLCGACNAGKGNREIVDYRLNPFQGIAPVPRKSGRDQIQGQ